MEWSWLPAVVGLFAVLFLMTRGVATRPILVVVAITLAIVLAVVLAERAGLWPASWRTR